MKLHKEGRKIAGISSLLFCLLTGTFFICLAPGWAFLADLPALPLLVLIIRFFRVPSRQVLSQADAVFSPADGKVVAIEEVFENEFYHETRKVVSVFMSIYNVHINWYPVEGEVIYQKYHPGKFLVAWHPKSSTDNERTTVVVGPSKQQSILLRQIAGAVARRIVCYAKANHKVTQNQELGFIKFGSRVDVFLPPDAEIKVSLNQKVTGSQTILAILPQ